MQPSLPVSSAHKVLSITVGEAASKPSLKLAVVVLPWPNARHLRCLLSLLSPATAVQKRGKKNTCYTHTYRHTVSWIEIRHWWEDALRKQGKIG